MTTNEIIEAVAELDGWTDIFYEQDYPTGIKPQYPKYPNPARYDLPSYATHRDVIIPVIDKVIGKDWHKAKLFIENLLIVWSPNLDMNHVLTLTATPPQLCEALLRATNRWKE